MKRYFFKIVIGSFLFCQALFVASDLNWKEKGVKLRQQTTFPDEEGTQIAITDGAASFIRMVRYPSWVKSGALKVFVNGKAVLFGAVPSSYMAINRHWKKGDVVKISLPMHTTVEQLPNVPEYIAFLHGPVLSGAKTGIENLRGLIADEGRWPHIPGGGKLPVDKHRSSSQTTCRSSLLLYQR